LDTVYGQLRKSGLRWLVYPFLTDNLENTAENFGRTRGWKDLSEQPVDERPEG
jgi:hypothetical protein